MKTLLLWVVLEAGGWSGPQPAAAAIQGGFDGLDWRYRVWARRQIDNFGIDGMRLTRE